MRPGSFCSQVACPSAVLTNKQSVRLSCCNLMQMKPEVLGQTLCFCCVPLSALRTTGTLPAGGKSNLAECSFSFPSLNTELLLLGPDDPLKRRLCDCLALSVRHNVDFIRNGRWRTDEAVCREEPELTAGRPADETVRS